MVTWTEQSSLIVTFTLTSSVNRLIMVEVAGLSTKVGMLNVQLGVFQYLITS